MSRVTIEPDTDHNKYYIPYHAVLRPDSTTTKMRIVASSKTSSGYSLNDNLFCGKKLQQDLSGIILRFRLHRHHDRHRHRHCPSIHHRY